MKVAQNERVTKRENVIFKPSKRNEGVSQILEKKGRKRDKQGRQEENMVSEREEGREEK